MTSLTHNYPATPGHNDQDTSIAAAEAIAPAAITVRQKIFRAINSFPGLTADEACHIAGVSLLSGRPRVTELLREGRVVDSGRRRALDSGKQGIVWKVAGKKPC